MNLIIFIESSQGLLALPEICKTAWQNSIKNHFIPDAIVFGSDDYCADIGNFKYKYNINKYLICNLIQSYIELLIYAIQSSILIASWLLGATRTKDAKELLYARQYIVMVAKAFKLQAIDIVHIDYKGKLRKY